MGDRGELEKIFDEARDAEYAEVLERCRDFHAELDKERVAGNLTFAEDLLQLSADDLADKLLEEAGVACLSGTGFGKYGEGHLRFSCANSRRNISSAVERMGEVF